ncbi:MULTISPECIES: SGNH/GDSL hydrolase family protein [Streptomyces]|uniref:G-D-S-L family lipolytic protein n=1 Tax=Streptomyces albus (strain ATCC 21838 / DSM 41398 / FERM P-419 / JCM 4703 / NBRC 107858) TaxID=1081613 RepID=A0A0B5EUM6_STRA4|nr:SGNH/GDSL hydrolase family protein [Streptomyces sp. SCSIO ZS0520]AJE85469.1 G-D-S-L family lipolytic protein [Streptomyces albus]AOU79772.1 G-D-S-L family lipolytic protein [Streptomyces albus]AYN35497.1 SGNH/GDSL hydrolase family protein [Streptomyces albus]
MRSLRGRRPLTSLFAAAAAACLAFTAAPAAQAAEGKAEPAAAEKYVALGDSYAVGPGTGTYDNPDDPCRRGPLTYPRLWAQAHSSYSFVEASCSGATTAELKAQQVPQLTADTTLATVQVGGNDVGFVEVLKNCILTLDDKDCIAGVEAAKAAATGSLPGALADTYGAVKAAAPNAKVIVVGYPRLYTIGGDCGILGLSDAERTALNSAADTLDGVLADQASKAGFSFLDPRSAFDPHSICSGGSQWVTSLEWSDIDESYHPNQAGHRDGYLPLLNALAG